MQTTVPTPPISRGVEVKLGQIDRELANLWKESHSVATRASLINFAIYTKGADAMEANSALLAELTRDHSCRAILIAADPDFPEPGVSAWINAHCHITRAGTKQVCCEQLSFHLRGPTSQLLPSIVFAHLDSDLPLYFWWQGEWGDEVTFSHIKWIDRLIFDSSTWKEPVSQFDRLRELSVALRSRERLCDLNWTRSSAMRLAVAHLFDHPTVLGAQDQIRSVEIEHGPQDGVQARLLVGWLAALLNWRSVNSVGDVFNFQDRSDQPLSVRFTSRGEEGIRSIQISTPRAVVQAERTETSHLIQTSILIGSSPPLIDFMPAGKTGLLEVLRAELATGGRHRVYHRALEVIHPHWA